jgi:FMN phosphatase YigB (HAD superfamily)
VNKVEHTKAVIFDLYETLITEFSNGRRKVTRTNRDYERLIGLPYVEFQQQWNDRQEMRMTGAYPDYFSVMNDIISKNNLVCEQHVLEDLYNVRVNEKSVPFADIAHDIIELLDGLKQRDIKLALISNCTEEEVSAWAGSKLPPYFDQVIFSYQVRYAKPDPKIYQLACSRLGVKAEQCIFVGDGGSQELDGASKAGITAYHAVWFLPDTISAKITAYEKLAKPSQLLEKVMSGRD